MKKIFIHTLLLLLAVPCFAQTSREEMAADLNKTGGVYYAYPATKADNTPAPKGYKPFHISHYGRHGSRYLIGDGDYLWVRDVLAKGDTAGALTPLGKDLLHRIDTLMVETRGRGGDLTPLGERQHRDIATRMYGNYPEVFADNAEMTARSTLVPRCILSMAAFCESLKEKNPRLVIPKESSNRNMYYICNGTPESGAFNDSKRGWWREVERKMRERNTHPDRLMSSLFSSPEFVERYVRPADLMWGIYWIAADAQNTEGKIDFYDLFTPDELFDLWQTNNANWYATHADYPEANGAHLKNARNLLTNIIETADSAIRSDRPSAALRFGHDGNVVPLTALMGLQYCDARIDDYNKVYEGWCDWKVSPMAANIQLVFYRNPKKPGDILVKILHNERETRIPVAADQWPYYRWADVKAYFEKSLRED